MLISWFTDVYCNPLFLSCGGKVGGGSSRSFNVKKTWVFFIITRNGLGNKLSIGVILTSLTGIMFFPSRVGVDLRENCKDTNVRLFNSFKKKVIIKAHT